MKTIDKDWLRQLARELLAALDKIARRAEADLEASPTDPPDVLATAGSSMAGDRRQGGLRRELDAGWEKLQRLTKEPYLARVVAREEGEQPRTIYIGRATPVRSIPELEVATYLSPLGRLASLPPGEATIPLPRGEREFMIEEQVHLRPSRDRDGWDALVDRIQTADGAANIKSIRALLAVLPVEDIESLYEELKAQDAAQAEVRQGLRRRVIDAMALRDQPILDQFQDEIFRLPLARRIMLSGPPGTGKTTTLIKRLAQKNDIRLLADNEQNDVQRRGLRKLFDGPNWRMFTPTELLRLYLKDAFAAEGIAATEDRLRTWSDMRQELARDVLPVLRTEDRRGGFLQRSTAKTLVSTDGHSLTGLADAFASDFLDVAWGWYAEALEDLSDSDDEDATLLAHQIESRVGQSRKDLANLRALLELRDGLNDLARRLGTEVDALLRPFENVLGRDETLITKVLSIRAAASGAVDPDIDDELDDGDEPVRVRASDQRVGLQAIRGAIAAQARAQVAGRRLGRESTARAIVDAIGTRMPAQDKMDELGRLQATARAARRLRDLPRDVVRKVPGEYHRFRIASAKAGAAHFPPGSTDALERRVAHDLEVDVMILAMLRNARSLVAAPAPTASTGVEVLDAISARYTVQVLVDEATDFSPVQLACMLELAHPSFRSYFTAGDMRQRVTSWGVDTEADLNWVAPDLEVRRINVAYRMSRRLAALAEAVGSLHGSSEHDRLAPADHVDDADIPPLFAEGLDGDELAEWLAARIMEVDSAVGRLPSMAVFVDGDDRIDPLVTALRPLLEDDNLPVVGCPGGRVTGSEREVRVFDIQHVKGLEFEAVFFVGIDDLATRLPDLFDKYIYVGITRAATYLGMTCRGSLPKSLAPMRQHFASRGWGQP